jgi:peroxiredoxin
MKDRTDTLQTGSSAPDFTLAAANREGAYSLAELISRGALILEFLRGTW